MHTEAFEYAESATPLEGFLAYDATLKGKRPCVLIAHAWGGLGEFEKNKAQALAQLGYVGFAMDVYGKGKRGTTPEQNAKLMQPLLDDRALLAKRLLAGFETMKKHLMVDSNRIGAIGFCFGGLCALDLARHSPAGLRGVVSFHGLFTPPKPAPNREITAKVLALHGFDDPLAPPEQIVALGKELTAAGADWQIHAYGNTVHAFTNPEANMPERGIVYNQRADERSWREMKAFFEEVLG